MELTLIAVVGVVAIVAVSAMSARIGVAAPLGLVVVGIALSFVPGLPDVTVDPEVILGGVLPPLLYSAAVRMPATDFRRNLKAIGGLAVLLVVVTTLGAGLLLNGLLPGLGLASALALGAIVSPTDAVAATAIGQRLGLPSRLLTILEGEGLVNDASALVLLSSAVAATTGTVHLWHVGLDFVYAVLAAAAVGWAVAEVTVRVRGRLADPVLNTAISFVVPFLAYVPAEALGASGVLAVVVAGLVAGDSSPRFVRAQDRLAETVNWATIAFLLESGIFLLMGLQLNTLLDQASAAGLSVGQAVGIGLLVAALAVVLRMLFVAPLVAALRGDAQRAATFHPRLDAMEAALAAGGNVGPRGGSRGGRPPGERRREQIMRRIARARTDIDFLLAEGFGWRGGVVLAWAGMRGAITVAAAQSLPEDTPLRPQLVLIAFVVAGVTLLAQGLTLPGVIRLVRVPGDDEAAERADYRALLDDLATGAEAVLGDPALADPDGHPYPPAVMDQARAELRLVGAGTEPADGAGDERRRAQCRELLLRVTAAERERLLDARALGAYRSRSITRALHALDVTEARLQRVPDLAVGGEDPAPAR
jgi:CPA1 family monovalent cation:H+ antiporter